MYTIYASVQDLIDRIMWMLSPGPTMIQLRWGASWLLGISAALVSIPTMRNRPGTGDFATLVATAGGFPWRGWECVIAFCYDWVRAGSMERRIIDI